MSGPLHAALIIYIALIGVMIVSGKMNEPLRDTWGRIARGAAIAGFLTAGTTFRRAMPPLHSGRRLVRTPLGLCEQRVVPGVATPTRTENPEAIWRHMGKTRDVPEFAK